MRRTLTLFITAVAAAAALAVTAAADPVSVQPLRDAGYTVGIAFQPDAQCTVWSISGHGLSTQLNDCDADAASTIASFTDPTLIFERDWQLNHPDQVDAAQAIAQHCYSISRTAAQADQWRIVGGSTDTTVAGADLPGLAGSLPNLRLPDNTCPSGTTAVVTPTTGGPGPDGKPTVTVPGAPGVTATIQTQAQALAAAAAAAAAPQPPSATTDPSAPPADPVDPANYTIVEASPEVTAETGIVAWVNTPYAGVLLTADDLPPVSA
jgi:hypothetical protein